MNDTVKINRFILERLIEGHLRDSTNDKFNCCFCGVSVFRDGKAPFYKDFIKHIESTETFMQVADNFDSFPHADDCPYVEARKLLDE